MGVWTIIAVATLVSVMATLATETVLKRAEHKSASEWLPEGALLLVSSDVSCPPGWSRRAAFLARLDAKTSDDFSSQDFEYLERNSSEELIRLRTCMKVD